MKSSQAGNRYQGLGEIDVNIILDNDTPKFVADVLLKVCPDHAHAIALTMHERMCKAGDRTQRTFWEAVIDELPNISAL
jgi:hypothetical protein